MVSSGKRSWIVRNLRHKHRTPFSPTVTLLTLLFAYLPPAFSQSEPPAEYKFRKYFVHYVDNRSITERVLNLVGLSDADVGRSFALIAGVSEYEYLDDLRPAKVDVEKLKKYLETEEFFDEIVVLENGDFTEDNLRYFLQAYFPERVSRFKKSRFLFAFSGHGINDGSQGYLLLSDAQSMHDKYRSLNLRTLRTYVQEVVRRGHHVLALINSCYGGNFVTPSFGEDRPIPRRPGAHAITAGGPNQLVYGDSEIGEGSVFFETFLAALDGRADTYPYPDPQNGRPYRGDGIITVDELHADLRETIRQWSNDGVTPLRGDLNPPAKKSLGSFFFLNRDREVISQQPASFSPRESFSGAKVAAERLPDSSASQAAEQTRSVRSLPILHGTKIKVIHHSGNQDTAENVSRMLDNVGAIVTREPWPENQIRHRRPTIYFSNNSKDKADAVVRMLPHLQLEPDIMDVVEDHALEILLAQ